MKKQEFIALSSCCMMLTALGIDIVLPALSAVRESYGLDEHSPQTAFIITFFFLGQVSQLLFGFLSDKYGRTLILRIGFLIYILSGIAAAFAPGIIFMFVARFFAGVGASAVFMTTIAGVRDRFEGDAMARTMSFIFTIFLFTPVLAPFLGALILKFASWKAVFLTPPVFGVIVFAWSLRLQQVNRSVEEASTSTDFGGNFKSILSNKPFLKYTIITTMLFAGISSYVSSSEHIVGDIFQRPKLFTTVFACVGLVMATGALINSKLVARFGAKQTIRGLLLCYTLVALVLLLVCSFSNHGPSLIFFFACIALLLGINLAVEPNSNALAMKEMGDKAGMAASIYGTIFFFGGALVGSVISAFIKASVLPMAIAFFIIGLVSFLMSMKEHQQLPA